MKTKEIEHYLATNPEALVRAVRDGAVSADLKIKGIPLISEAVASDNQELLSALIERHTDVNAYASKPAAEHGMAPIHFAKSPAIVAALAKAGANIDAPYKDVPHAWGMPGETALHSALLGQSAQHLQLSEALLKAGANPTLPYSVQEYMYGKNSIQSMSERVVREGTTIATRLETQRINFGQHMSRQPEVSDHDTGKSPPADKAIQPAMRSVEGRVMAFGFDDEQVSDTFYIEIDTAGGHQKYLADCPKVPPFEDNKVDIGEVIELQLDANGRISSVKSDRTEIDQRESAPAEPTPVHPSGDDGTMERQGNEHDNIGDAPTTVGIASTGTTPEHPSPTDTAINAAGTSEVKRQRRIETQATAVAKFIEMNVGHEAWRVESEVRRAPPPLKNILGSKARMAALAPYIAEKTGHLDPLHVLETNATIASTLRRPDYRDVAVAVANARGRALATPSRPQPDVEPSQATAVQTPTLNVPTTAHKHTLLAEEVETPSAPTPIHLTRNGIVPASESDFDHASARKKVLDDMSYKVRSDGTVLYQVAGADAFVDHGDQLLMVSGADKQERAILGALLLAKEKYGGAFELTGDAAFKKAALALIVKHRLDVRLKNPEQDAMMRDMLASARDTHFPAASPQNPVKPVDLRQTQPSSPAQHVPVTAPAAQPTENPDQPPVTALSTRPINEEVLEGTLVRLGYAPYLKIPDNKTSFFMEIRDDAGTRSMAWGAELDPRNAGIDLRSGDHVRLIRPLNGKNRLWKLSGIPDQPFERPSPSTGADVHDVLENLTEEHSSPGTPPVRPSENKPRAEQSTAVKMQAPTKAEGYAGKMIDHGAAPYQFDGDNPVNYFATLEQLDGSQLTIWGKELRGAILDAEVGVGDEIALKPAGKTPVTVKKYERDEKHKIIDVTELDTRRNAWELKVFNRAVPQEQDNNDARGGSSRSIIPTAIAEQAGQHESSVNRLDGILLRHGSAPHKNAPGGKPSYFAELRNSDGKQHTAWGVDLARAIGAAGAVEGEHVMLQNLGRRAVQIDKPDLDRNGQIQGIKKGVSYRNQWEVEVKSRAQTSSNTLGTDEPAPADSIVIRPAAWWERQISFVQRYVGDVPDLLTRVERLGPLAAPEQVSYLDEQGRTREASDMDGLKDSWRPARRLIPGVMTPVVTGGNLDGYPFVPSLSLTRGGEGYLQGLAQVGATIKHVVVLLQTRPEDPSPAVLPVLAATATEAGTSWKPIGFGLALPMNAGPNQQERHDMLRFELGRKTIDAKVALDPNDGLRRQLGLPPTGRSITEPAPRERQRANTTHVPSFK